MSLSISTTLSSALPIAALGLLASCKVTDVSNEEQSASLAPYAAHKIRGVEIEHYFNGRTAILIGAGGLEISDDLKESSSEDPETREFSFTARFDRGQLVEFGTAVAIDPRGYFVTAGHCIDGHDLYALFFNKDKKPVARKVEPVWLKNSYLPEIDFAVFLVEGVSYGTFQWAGSLEIGEPVFSAGTTLEVNEDADPSFQYSMDSFAGEVKKTRHVRFDGTQFQLIWHRSPVRKGNSGGPLINEKGELIGVNYAASSPIQRAAGKETTPMAYAIRPDLIWIRNLIEEDWAKRQGN